MLNRRIAHLTSVHPRYDTRIFLKECHSLTWAGYSVSLVVADGKGDEIKSDIHIYDVGLPGGGRLRRIRHTPKLILLKALELDADIYHLHDPELIPIGLKLRKFGKKVIFDAHEDVPKQMMGKPYLNKLTLWVIAKTFLIYEIWACKKLNAIVTATPFIRDKFLLINPDSIDINNFPMLGELSIDKIDWSQKEKQVCYVGGIASIRGIKEIVRAMELLTSGARLQLGGNFSEKETEAEVKSGTGWHNVDELGFVDRKMVRDVLAKSVAGLVTFLPLPNHIDAQPNKMFEYMSAGIPVIASNFPLWRKIIEENDCGLCVDPLKSNEIADAIDFLVTNPDRAQQMGHNGRWAVIDRYNWEIEEKKLLVLYDKLLNRY